MFDWELAIEKNHAALTQIVAGLFVLVGWGSSLSSAKPTGLPSAHAQAPRQAASSGAATEGGQSSSPSFLCSAQESMPEGDQHIQHHRGNGKFSGMDPRQKGEDDGGIFLPRKTRNHLASVLRTAESALRRLIVLFVRVHGITASVRKKPDNRPLPDFSSFGQGASDRPPRFNLIDPRKSLTLMLSLSKHEGGTLRQAQSEGNAKSHKPIPRIWTVDMPIPVTAQKPEPTFLPNSTSLLRRLRALDHALRTLPQQAKRLARIIEQRKKAPPGPKQYAPIRGGYPPGHRQKPIHDVDYILLECHGLVRDHEQLPP